MTPEPQVARGHYFNWSYLKKERWMNFWYQLDLVRRSGGQSVLEVGKGNGVVADLMRRLGLAVTTLDIDPALEPDLVGSVTAIPLADKSVDVVLAAEVLEHIPWSEVPRALDEIARVSRAHAVITLPYPGRILAGTLKLPRIPWLSWIWKLPRFSERHVFDGQHHWELGKRGSSRAAFRSLLAAAGFVVVEEGQSPDDPGRYRFLLRL